MGVLLFARCMFGDPHAGTGIGAPRAAPTAAAAEAAAVAPEVAARRLLIDEETEGVADWATAVDGADDAKAPVPADAAA